MVVESPPVAAFVVVEAELVAIVQPLELANGCTVPIARRTLVWTSDPAPT